MMKRSEGLTALLHLTDQRRQARVRIARQELPGKLRFMLKSPARDGWRYKFTWQADMGVHDRRFLENGDGRLDPQSGKRSREKILDWERSLDRYRLGYFSHPWRDSFGLLPAHPAVPFGKLHAGSARPASGAPRRALASPAPPPPQKS